MFNEVNREADLERKALDEQRQIREEQTTTRAIRQTARKTHETKRARQTKAKDAEACGTQRSRQGKGIDDAKKKQTMLSKTVGNH